MSSPVRSDSAVDPARRGLLRGRVGPTRRPRRPPWAVAGFEDACTRCGACLEACPEGILVAGDGGFPEVDFSRGCGECTFCQDCVQVCPEPAFDASLTPPWKLLARIDDSCLARNGIHCQSCGEICAWGAIRFALVRGAPPQPVVAADACTGCGACVAVCPEDAISAVNKETAHG